MVYKKLSYCWETVRRESMPRIADRRGNDNLGWNDLQMYFKVIKSGTNRKLVYDFLIVVYSNFCRITPFLRNLMWNSPMSLKYAQGHWQSYHLKAVAWPCIYVKCSEDSEWMKRKSPFSTTPLSINTPLQQTPENICINLIPAETTFPGLHFCRWHHMGNSANWGV